MGIIFECDAPGCGARGAGERRSEPGRVTALEIVGLRDRENPAERPVIYLPPFGWSPVAMRDGRRLYACSGPCQAEILGCEGRSPTGTRIGESCPACGRPITGG